MIEDDKNTPDIILDDLPTYDQAKFSSLQTDFILWHRPPPAAEGCRQATSNA